MLYIRIKMHFIKLLVYIHVTLKYGMWNFCEFIKFYPWMLREFGHIFKNIIVFSHELGWSVLLLCY